MATTPTAKYAIELDDDTSGAANQAATALSRLKDKISDDTSALIEMKRAMRNLKGDTSVTAGELKRMANIIDAQKASIGASQKKFLKLGGTFGGMTVQQKKASDEAKKLKIALEKASAQKLADNNKVLADKTKLVADKNKELVSSLGPLGSKLSQLKAFLANPITLVIALVAALGAFVVATGAAVAALATYGFAQSGARREEALRLEGLNSLREQYGRTTASIEGMQSAIDRASDATGLGRSQLEGYTRQLTRVGLRGEALAQALEGTAIAASVQGERGAARFRALAVNAALTGRSVRDLADDYRARLGPIARRQMLGLDRQSQRVRQGLDRIFSGLRIETFLGAINEITDQFSQTSQVGQSLKALVEGLFQPLFDQSETLGPLLRRFFQGMTIAALQIGIAFLEIRNAIRDTFGDQSLLDMNSALLAGKVIAFGAAIVFGTLAIAAGLVAVSMLAMVAAMLLIPALIALAIFGLVQLFNFLTSSDFEDFASDLINGLIDGLRNGANRLTQQVRILAAGVSSTFEDVLGIGSPSRVFEGYGMNVTQGFTRGIADGAADANAAVGGLVNEPSSGGLGGGATSVSIGDINISGVDAGDARELAERIRDELASVLQGVSIEMGAT